MQGLFTSVKTSNSNVCKAEAYYIFRFFVCLVLLKSSYLTDHIMFKNQISTFLASILLAFHPQPALVQKTAILVLGFQANISVNFCSFFSLMLHKILSALPLKYTHYTYHIIFPPLPVSSAHTLLMWTPTFAWTVSTGSELVSLLPWPFCKSLCTQKSAELLIYKPAHFAALLEALWYFPIPFTKTVFTVACRTVSFLLTSIILTPSLPITHACFIKTPIASRLCHLLGNALLQISMWFSPYFFRLWLNCWRSCPLTTVKLVSSALLDSSDDDCLLSTVHITTCMLCLHVLLYHFLSVETGTWSEPKHWTYSLLYS